MNAEKYFGTTDLYKILSVDRSTPISEGSIKFNSIALLISKLIQLIVTLTNIPCDFSEKKLLQIVTSLSPR